MRGQVRGGALGLGIGSGVTRARESRFSRALVPVCAVIVLVCDVLYDAEVCAHVICLCMYVCACVCTRVCVREWSVDG